MYRVAASFGAGRRSSRLLVRAEGWLEKVVLWGRRRRLVGPGAGVDEVDVVLVAASASVRGRRSVVVGRPRPLVRGDLVGGEARRAAFAPGLGREDGVKPR